MENNSIESIGEKLKTVSQPDDLPALFEELVGMRDGGSSEWRRILGQFNDEVDMKKLGFEDDFQIFDIEPGRDGLIINTLSEDGFMMQQRDSKHLEIVYETDNIIEMYGASESGKGSFWLAKEGDTIRSIAECVLQSRYEKQPSEQDISKLCREIAMNNAIDDPKSVPSGQLLLIPLPEHKEWSLEQGWLRELMPRLNVDGQGGISREDLNAITSSRSDVYDDQLVLAAGVALENFDKIESANDSLITKWGLNPFRERSEIDADEIQAYEGLERMQYGRSLYHPTVPLHLVMNRLRHQQAASSCQLSD